MKELAKLGIALYIAKKWGLENNITQNLKDKIKAWAREVAG